MYIQNACMCICMCIYIYIYREREKESPDVLVYRGYPQRRRTVVRPARCSDPTSRDRTASDLSADRRASK